MTEFFTQRDIATIIMDSTAIFIVLGIYSQSKVIRKRGHSDDRLYFALLWIDLIIAASDIVTYIADGKHFPGAVVLNLAGITVFYISMVLFFMAWLKYTETRFFKRETVISRHKTAFAVPGVITLILLVINIFTGFIFSVSADNVYTRGILFVPMYLIMAFYLFGGFFVIFIYRRRSSRKKLVPLWTYMAPILIGILVPFVFGGISFASVCIAIGLMFTHIGTMNEQMAINKQEGRYERA